MPTLRITQLSISPGRHRAAVTLRDDHGEQAAEVDFDFAVSQQDRERLRWYLEDYLQFPLDPAPAIAQSVERDMVRIGVELFRKVFQSHDQGRDLWALLRSQLSDTRVELATGVQEATTIPWELLRDPATDVPLALRARAFVRVQSQTAQRPKMPVGGAGPIRILLVICRPDGRVDVPFRSVAARLLKAVGVGDRGSVHLDLLRPATFQRLGEMLREAKTRGQPYHVVHFDGHGVVLDVNDLFQAREKREADEEFRKLLESLLNFDPSRFSPQAIYPGVPRRGQRGYLAFENADSPHNLRLVDGPELGSLLAETDVPVLILNACRSAHADPPAAPVEGEQDIHNQTRSIGSLAQEVIDAGVAGVVAMRHNVYVVTAAKFVADLYSALTRGQPLGEAVSLGRKQLAANPLRTIAHAPRALQDWPVPVVYEAAPIKLFPNREVTADPVIEITSAEMSPRRGRLDPQLPARPDAGFYGRDETLLALDRAFDRHPVVLLHGNAGSGKTATASEFARWYSQTGGVDGPVLFTTFEQYRPLSRVLDQLGQVFQAALERSGIRWPALSNTDRRAVSLDVLKKNPVLWVWDNVEPVAGFPPGSASVWTDTEQRELVGFLREVRETGAKFLLTSRRDERGWLADLPARVQVPRMPMQERVQLAGALADKQGRQLGAVEDWRSLLEFTEGNPMTLISVVGHALREGVRTKDDVTALVGRLRAGELPFDDEPTEGRTKSLGASLNYGFENAFTAEEQKVISLLHLFQGFVDVTYVANMLHPPAPHRIDGLAPLSPPQVSLLFDRLGELGVLTRVTDSLFRIHPAVPWFLRDVFLKRFVGGPDSDEIGTTTLAEHGFARVMGRAGEYFYRQVSRGLGAAARLEADESNLLHGVQLCLMHSWTNELLPIAQGLRGIYRLQGRRVEWARLVGLVTPYYIDPGTNTSRSGEDDWFGLIREYHADLAHDARDWPQVERIQAEVIQWDRERATGSLNKDRAELTEEDRHLIRNLAVATERMGHALLNLKKEECLREYHQARTYYETIDDKHGQAVVALNLGHVYKDIPLLFDPDAAEKWYEMSLELREAPDWEGRAVIAENMAMLAHSRFWATVDTNGPAEDAVRHLERAANLLIRVIRRVPPEAAHHLGPMHNHLGVVLDDAGSYQDAVTHFSRAIQYAREIGDAHLAADAQYNAAIALDRDSRHTDALEYARAALKSFTGAGADIITINDCHKLIGVIERNARAQRERSAPTGEQGYNPV
ncbi:CHAT domain-containing protein [Gemmata sp. JC717]|uniref:CHAT domain-containing protein n=1 Tax=Gemmata algarum TaxID=2975278 RepID=UPI0021BA6816|nr:CHAT domain-containing protein [Gemmata algarum]MDY3555986.1 CHAT domain-containing protein [Gemmata algarum]